MQFFLHGQEVTEQQALVRFIRYARWSLGFDMREAVAVFYAGVYCDRHEVVLLLFAGIEIKVLRK